MKTTRRYSEPSRPFMETLAIYRRMFKRALNYKERLEVKEDFYNFTEVMDVDYVDWCWGYIAMGSFGK